MHELKRCRRCKRERREAMFEGKRTICRLCQIEYKIAHEYEKTHPEVSYCTSCRAYKSKDQFYQDPRYKKKPRSHCKECVVKENVADKILRRLEKLLNIPRDKIMSIACGARNEEY